MKKLYFLLIALCLFTTTKAQIVNIPDVKFKAALLRASPANTVAKDLSGNYFRIDANRDREIQISEALAVSSLFVSSQINDLTGISSFTNLTSLECFRNELTSLDVTSLINLTNLNCSQNQLTSLDLTPLVNLISLRCDGNEFISLDVSPLKNLTALSCTYNKLTFLDVTPLIKLTSLDCANNQLTTIDLTPLVNLTSLLCHNNKITSLDVTTLVNLTLFACSNNELSSIDLTTLVNLTELHCSSNRLTTLELKSLVNLINFDCSLNQIVSLNLAPLVNLKSLYCSGNRINSLNVTSLDNLQYIACDSNELTSLNLSTLINLKTLICSQNQLTSLDLSNQKNLGTLYCQDNNFTSLFLKNTNIGYNEAIGFGLSLRFSGNVQYICVNEKILFDVQRIIDLNGYTNSHVNTYCSFTPSGEYYSIEGNTKLDFNNSGCDVEDLIFPNLKFSISDGVKTGILISNIAGNYFLPVEEGTQTITPILENLPYFIVSPTNTVVTFPTQTSPFTQDFCVTANGIHPDLEVATLPTTRARAGFDASYKIIYKNKGTNTQSGSVNLIFDDAVIDLVSASPVVSSQTVNNLSWSFVDLKPFETREIIVTVNVNSPTEIPAVNIGNTLDFTTTITSSATDETPADNTFTLNQIVVGSFDPNDKTCLEGSTIPPSAVGKYVHYMIRFENKGTAEAQNVVVKDMIDTSKFDVSSLVVTQGSHSFVTRITETNKVEFIFENINLPFDDATNDGYVAFKIKTKPSLVVGDSFSNTASIYFDYNFPIVTNTATTSVLQNLGTPDFEFDSYFKIYPNPVKDILDIDVKKQIEVTSISIFNMLGQQILVIPNAQQTKQIDVSSLKTGNYFIKMSTNKGISNARFIKS